MRGVHKKPSGLPEHIQRLLQLARNEVPLPQTDTKRGGYVAFDGKLFRRRNEARSYTTAARARRVLDNCGYADANVPEFGGLAKRVRLAIAAHKEQRDKKDDDE